MGTKQKVDWFGVIVITALAALAVWVAIILGRGYIGLAL